MGSSSACSLSGMPSSLSNTIATVSNDVVIAHLICYLHCNVIYSWAQPGCLAVAEGDGKSSKPGGSSSLVTASAVFDKAGSLIFMGQSKGTITVVDANSLRFVDMIKVCPRAFVLLPAIHMCACARIEPNQADCPRHLPFADASGMVQWENGYVWT